MKGEDQVTELGPFRFLVMRGLWGYAARIKRADGEFFLFRGTKTDGLMTTPRPSVGAAHAEAMRLIQTREIQ